MTTKEQAERLINTLREQGFTDEEIVEATIGLFERMRDGIK
jgi:alkylhydroperoxidase family enzyme